MSPIRQSSEVRDDELGAVAKHLRKTLGLIARDVADDLGVTRSALSRAEGGDPKLFALALRAVNHLVEKAAEKGVGQRGRIKTLNIAYGGAADVVGFLRAPERSRIAGMIRMALLPFGHSLEVAIESGTATVGLQAEGEQSFQIDLDKTNVTLVDGRHSRYVGRILQRAHRTGDGHEEREAARIYAFASALDRALVGAGEEGKSAMNALTHLLRSTNTPLPQTSSAPPMKQ